jgi:spore maturation protein CgeB
LGHTAAEIHVTNPWLQAAWAREHGMATGPLEPPGVIGRKGVPAWLQRVVTPFKPILRPLARKIGMSPSAKRAGGEGPAGPDRGFSS